MNFKEIKKLYNLTNKKMSEIFGFKTEVAYRNSSAKKRYEDVVVKLFEEFKKEKK
ncbi:hypothetical protein [Chishuiella sp.]|uniref:hypothetical protein n=1 Tax=Chishuiella sp. TaxID=1969467 RepID=UPI0028B19948|nr:hypothetical protein [Chishuiella sp.]